MVYIKKTEMKFWRKKNTSSWWYCVAPAWYDLWCYWSGLPTTVWDIYVYNCLIGFHDNDHATLAIDIIEPHRNKTFSDTNQPAQPQKLARENFIKKRDCAICVVKTKALISYVVTAHLLCTFSAYANILFSHDSAQLYEWIKKKKQLD